VSTYFSATGEDDALTGSGGVAGGGTYISLHSASPSTTGANEISGGAYARVQTTWGASSAGSNTGSQVTINVPAATTVAYFGIWSTLSGGTYIGGGPLPNSETYTGAGQYLLTPTLSATG
jgi:hypothetical protein